MSRDRPRDFIGRLAIVTDTLKLAQRLSVSLSIREIHDLQTAYIDIHERMDKIAEEETKAEHHPLCNSWDSTMYHAHSCNCFKARILALTKGTTT